MLMIHLELINIVLSSAILNNAINSTPASNQSKSTNNSIIMGSFAKIQ